MRSASALACLALMTSTTSLAQGSSTEIAYDGVLLDEGTGAEGPYAMTFTIVDDVGATLWSEEQTVTVSSGFFFVLLGAQEELPAALYDTTPSLRISVEGTALAGEQRLLPVPFAVRAQEGRGFLARDSLSVRGASGGTRILVEESDLTTAARELLTLRNNGGVRVALEDTSGTTAWQLGSAGADFIINDDVTLLNELTLGANGSLVIRGTLTTGGPTCGGGCDDVLDPSFPLESIAEHAETMRALGYLPAVGATPIGAPFDVTEKSGGMLHELEKAHLYIADLEQRFEDLASRLVTLERSCTTPASEGPAASEPRR